MLTGLLALAGVIVGYLLKMLSDIILHRLQSARELKAREAARLDAAKLRHNGFQRESLLSLQDAVARLARANGRTFHADLLASRSGSDWGKSLLPADLDAEVREAVAAVVRLEVRIADPEIRDLSSRLRGSTGTLAASKSEAEAEAAVAASSEIFVRLNEAIGGAVRALDEEWLARPD